MEIQSFQMHIIQKQTGQIFRNSYSRWELHTREICINIAFVFLSARQTC